MANEEDPGLNESLPSATEQIEVKGPPALSLKAGSEPRSPKVAVAVFVVSALEMVIAMSARGHHWWSIMLGLLGTIGAAGSFVLIWDRLVPFGRLSADDAGNENVSATDKPVDHSIDASWMARPVSTTVASEGFWLSALTVVTAGVAFVASIVGAASSRGPQWVWGLTVTIAFALFVASIFRAGSSLGVFSYDESGARRPLLQRHGFWLLVLAGALYLPCMGNFSLWDPWETHYGEVAREILAKDDWISLWWAQEGWFFSKPILNFWIQALAMGILGAHFEPDKMLIGNGSKPDLHPEWIVRAPVVLMAIVALYVIYKGVSLAFGRRAAFLGGLVLATMPQWYFLSHQTMTDMPFVAPLTAAMGLLLYGVGQPEDKIAKSYELRLGSSTCRVSAWHFVMGAIAVVALPQIFYLATRHIEFVVGGEGFGFKVPHLDVFRSGSGMGNCNLPGNEACRSDIPPAIKWFQPIVQALVWLSCLVTLFWLNRRERRIRQLAYLGAWMCAAIAMMGKGPAGIVLPVLCAGAYIITKRRWREFERLQLGSGLLIILAVALPWYVAMYARHGGAFIQRLIFHDMVNRVFDHVHDTNEGDDTSFRFYIWQLGYAFFPWVGLIPTALVRWLKYNTEGDDKRADTSVFLSMWFLFSFGLFSFAGTKFHHYIFPAVPPAAMLVGVLLDDMMSGAKTKLSTIQFVLLALSAVLAVAGFSMGVAGPIFGTVHGAASAHAPSFVWAITLGLGAVASFIGAFIVPGAEEPVADTTPAEASSFHEGVMIGGGVLGGVAVLLLVGRDLTLKSFPGEAHGPMRLLQLFTYNYKRIWPEHLDFTSPLFGITAAVVVLAVLTISRQLRPKATVALCIVGFVSAVWGLDSYMVKTAPHWGQRDIIEAYYRDRSGPHEQLVAYQMNWKGENFYTGNKIPAYVSSGVAFTQWVKQQKTAGQKVMYFVTEPGRIGGLKREAGVTNAREITDKTTCNKFVIVRAEL